MRTQAGLTAEQHRLRRMGIGGSDAAALVGADPFKSPLDIYNEKLGLQPPAPPTKHMRRGTELEPNARRLYVELTGRRIDRVGQNVHPDYNWMRCLADGRIRDSGRRSHGDGTRHRRGVLEIKCPAVHSFAAIKRSGLPQRFAVQMQHNLAVTGASWGSFAIFNADLWEMIHFDVERDEQFIELLIQAEQEFWVKHVAPRVPPPMVDVQVKLELPPIEQGELILRNDPDWQESVRAYVEATALKADAEMLVDGAKAKLKELMGSPTVVEGAGLRCYWSQRKGKASFDKTTLTNAGVLDPIAVGATVYDWQVAVGADVTTIPDLLRRLAAEARVDLSRYEEIGQPYKEFRAYHVKAPQIAED